MVELKLFEDLTNALDRASSGGVYGFKIEEIYRLIDTALLMVIARLTYILDPKRSGDFQSQVSKLRFETEWLNAEQSICLCANLRAARDSDPESSDKNLDAQIDKILRNERELATYIGNKLNDLSFSPYRGNLEMARDALIRERKMVIQKEITKFPISLR
jgi:hypothetical protein